MKFHYCLLTALLLLFAGLTGMAEEPTNSTYYLIRHAEKDLSTKNDPALTEQGQQRAHIWSQVFRQIKLDHVYSTDTRRTRDTAMPTAEAQGLALELYSWSDMDFAEFRQQHAGQTVLIVGHSNTSPAFTNGLIEQDVYPELDESVYGNLYIVDLIDENKNSKLLTINP